MPSPAASSFGGSSGDEEHDIEIKIAPSPIQTLSMEAVQRREEEKAREARTRALRSVMAYLRDMHDLGLTQVNTMSMYGGPLDAPGAGARSRRPTVVDNSRLPSDSSIASLASIGGASQLRSAESRNALRSGNSAQTNSVATTDSSGSGGGEERKYKDDKGKRARIMREIVEYVHFKHFHDAY